MEMSLMNELGIVEFFQTSYLGGGVVRRGTVDLLAIFYGANASIVDGNPWQIR